MSAGVVMSLDVLVGEKSQTRPVFVDTCGMDVITSINERRSIRKFTAEPISDRMLSTILRAGLQAPSAKNKRPCHFIVVSDKQILTELARSNSNAAMLEGAACGIVVCGDCNIEGMKEFLYADCAAAAQNMLLCIQGLGLAGVWCAVVSNSDWRKQIIEQLELPLKLEPIAVVALGHPDEGKERHNRWEPEKIHYNRW